MIVVFTLCSANYLSHAKALGESLLELNSDCRFVIGLVDRIPATMTPSAWHPFELIAVEELAIERFAEMAAKYSVVELNTAAKPFFISHLYRRDPKVECVIYLDPDILVFSSLQSLVRKLRLHPLIFTPHSCVADNSKIVIEYEQAMLSNGVYNLGFLGTHRSPETFAFLDWWEKRLVDYCYYRPGSGLFVDQLWTVLAPVYFETSHVEKHPGYNMAYWNLFERRLSRDLDAYMVNGTHPLVFYHFSNYNPRMPERLANRAWPDVPTFAQRPEMLPLFDDYRARLLRNGFNDFNALPCYFGAKQKQGREKARAGWLSLPIRLAQRVLGGLPTRPKLALGRAARFVATNCTAGRTQ